MTYWDHLGWRDTFGSEAFTARQRDYEAGLGRDGPFTPQVVVKGVGDTVGNRLDPLRAMIGRTKPPAKVPIDIKSNVIEIGGGMAPASGAETRNGTFTCAGCERDLFASDTKFESGTGWPSFRQPVRGGVVTTRDTSFGMVRDAVECSRCGGHLGHVFDDGPKPTGLRYCMNGIAMHFRPAAA